MARASLVTFDDTDVSENEERMMLTKLRRLSPERRRELAGVVDRMLEDESFHWLVADAPVLSSKALARSWSNPKDAEYNDL